MTSEPGGGNCTCGAMMEELNDGAQKEMENIKS